ncbi:hypothetical protein PspS04_12680 [Pseudomonas sp. S04]|nr:hypothetical protein PspS04_12680 [Pseudomonas sp. S04]QHF33644.1 hypothetical protein PspS19_12685 [Pseudomonas sp. S19]
MHEPDELPTLSLRQGTIADATIIHAPSSTKNEEGKRDPEMHQTQKGTGNAKRRVSVGQWLSRVQPGFDAVSLPG